MQTPLVELKLPLKLDRKREIMPFAILSSIQAVVISDVVYVGGGYCLSESLGATVMVYSLSTRSWRKLLCYATQWFGMAALNNELVLVGGRSISETDMVTNALGVWDKGSQTWTHPYPGMPSGRHSPSVVSYQNWLIVAGGGNQLYSHLRKVELLDACSGQWYEGPPLPSAYSDCHMSSAINGNMWYLSGGYFSGGTANKHVLCVCLDELISQAVSQSATASSPSTPSPCIWQTLTDPPLVLSTVLTYNGALLVVGGLRSSAIHLYQPSSRSWVKAGHLPNQRWQCACTVLPSGEIFVAGGSDGFADIATIHNVM